MIKVLLLSLLVISMALSFPTQNAFAATSFVNVDISGSPNPNDIPYGIVCNDDDHRWITIEAQGALARIDKSDSSVTLFNDDADVSGENWRGVTLNNDTGVLYIQERDNGKVKTFDTNSNAWGTVPLIPEITDAGVSYPQTYTEEPATIAINEPVEGLHTYQLSSTGFAGIVYHDSFVYAGLNYDFDFDANGNTVTPDISFNGLVKINPTNNAKTYIPISSTDITGIAEGTPITSGVGNSTTTKNELLYITSMTDDKVFILNSTSETVIDTITLTPNSKPRGIAVDENHIYVAMNKAAGGVSQFLQIDKSNTNIKKVKTTPASNTAGGTFSIFVEDGVVFWTDQSGHVGTWIIQNNEHAATTTTGNTESNHAGCADNGNFYWAGQGSVKQGSIPIPSSSNTLLSSSGGGSGDPHKTRPTIGLSHETNERLVDNGFMYNVINPNNEIYDNLIQITDNDYTPFPQVNVTLGHENMFGAKLYADKKPKVVEFLFGVPEVQKGHLKELGIEVWIDHLGDVTELKAIQKSNVIDKETLYATLDKVECMADDVEKNCYLVKVFPEFLEPLKDKFMAVKVIDHKLRYQTTYLNEGFNVKGDSLNDMKTQMIPGIEKGEGLIKVTQTEKYSDIWLSDNGREFFKNDFDTFIFIIPDSKLIPNPRVDIELRQWTIDNAIEVFDSSSLISELPESFSYDYPTISKRDITLGSLDWYVEYQKGNQ
jgi:YVTN family beta-propeller protein